MGNVVYSWDQFDFFAQPGLHFRSPVNTDMDFVLDTEVFYDIGTRWEYLGRSLCSRDLIMHVMA